LSSEGGNVTTEEGEEIVYPHCLATPTQTSYFVQLSGLFESGFEEKFALEDGSSKDRRIEGEKFKGESFLLEMVVRFKLLMFEI